ncbi:hypothetical protein BD779DRAFT_1516928 [Infundibulicybe gibba]|nr:hypothetical protein BD779DRAFT_1516928 [Infundibulicybe gibba]
MVTLRLHNAIHSPEYTDLPHGAQPPHIRNLSTLSSTTLRTNSDSSHPTEPLLSDSAAHLNLLPHPPAHSSDQHPAWDTGNAPAPDTASQRARNGFWERSARRVKRLKYMKIGLEVLMGAWGVYTTVRYFLAYAADESMTAQAAALALGTSSALDPLRYILTICTALHYISSLFLIGPTIVNLVLLFLWKDAADTQINIRTRCHPDVDVVWPTSGQCHSAWGVWLALVLARLVVTLSITTLYHLLSSAYHHATTQGTRRPRPGLRTRSSFTSPSITAPAMTEISPTSFALPLSVGYSYPQPQHQSSYSTLGSRSGSKYSTSEEVHGEGEGYAYAAPDLAAGPGRRHGENEHELTGFVDRFRTLVTQITHETEAGLEFARPEHSYPYSPSSHTDDIDTDDPDTYYSYAYPTAPLPPTLGYDEFGRPYPPDEHVHVLGGFVRRMPTIESMGSREIGSVMSSVRRDSMRSSSYMPSRASTRAGWTGSGSEPPSRRSSAGAGVGVGMRASEVGELLDRSSIQGQAQREREKEASGARRVGSTGSVGSNSNAPRSGVSYPSTTYSSASFYTATSATAQGPAGVDEFGYAAGGPG